SELEKGKEVGWIDIDDISDDDLTACPFLMGSIAPHTEQTIKEMASFGLGTVKNKQKDCLAIAIQELSNYTGKKVNALIPIELGGANTPGCIAAGLITGIPTIDGDYTGRAIPEISQTTPYLHDKSLLPITTSIMSGFNLSHHWIFGKADICLRRATGIETTSGRYVYRAGYLAYRVDFVRF
ncbi:unnamed protein product, partial [marine sediment metagenome]